MIGIADDEGDGTAATKSVRLKAAKAVIGESDAQLSVSVDVQNNIVSPIAGGYAYAPCNRPLIEAKPATLPRGAERPPPDEVLRHRRLEAREEAEREVEREAARTAANPIFRPLGY